MIDWRIAQTLIPISLILLSCSSIEMVTEQVYIDDVFDNERRIYGKEVKKEIIPYETYTSLITVIDYGAIDSLVNNDDFVQYDPLIEHFVSVRLFYLDMEDGTPPIYDEAKFQGNVVSESFMVDGSADLTFGMCCKIEQTYHIPIPSDYMDELDGSFQVRLTTSSPTYGQPLVLTVTSEQLDEQIEFAAFTLLERLSDIE